MRTRLIALVLVASLPTAFSTTRLSAQASTPRIPASVYPSGAQITYSPHLSNRQVDCMWGFICESGLVPNFHYLTQDMLGRVSGWGQFAGVHRVHKAAISFQLFASRYSSHGSTSGSVLAFRDFTQALKAQGYRASSPAARLLPQTRSGSRTAAVQDLGGKTLVTMAVQIGSLEIEGIALYPARQSQPMRTAWSSLANQVRAAVKSGA